MDPVAFTLFGIEIKWYGVIISTAVLIGIILAVREAERKGIGEDNIIDMLLYAIPLAVIGARIHFVIFSWDNYKGDWRKIINFREGGLAIHGAIIVAVIVAVIFSKKRKLDFWTIADICAPSLILGQAIGRWGNFINQEAHGGPTDLPWGIMIDGVKVHPTFLYESLGSLLIFFFLLWYRKNKSKESGEIFLLYVILYSLVRFFVEGLRTDSLMVGPLRTAQLISVISIVVGLVFFTMRRKKYNKERL